MDVGRQKLRKNCDFEVSIITASHEMDVGHQRLRKNCDLEVLIVFLSHGSDVGHYPGKVTAVGFEPTPLRTGA